MAGSNRVYLGQEKKLWQVADRLWEVQGIRTDTLRRLLAKVEEYSESHRAVGLPDDLLNILKDDLEYEAVLSSDCL